MDISQIRKLIKLVQSSDVTEIEITEGESTVRISRHTAVAPVMAAAPTMAEYAVAAPAVSVAAAAVAEEANSNEEHQVTSPMVGTFYAAASPDADDFVREGQKVKKGDTLCIIEAMKMMNEIEAEYDGVVESILVTNATPLEYGQAMFVITPLG